MKREFGVSAELIVLAEDEGEFLSLIGPVSDENRFESCKACRIPDTCSWIFSKEEYCSWASSDFPNSTAKVLYIHGPAGFGKSVLCARIVEVLQDTQEGAVVYHFCVSHGCIEENMTGILRSWIVQMAQSDDHLLRLALEELRQSPQQTEPTSLWKLFTVLVKCEKPWTFVVDGIDECQVSEGSRRQSGSEGRSTFLKNLIQAVVHTKSRVLIVSRDEPDIRAVLFGRPGNDVDLHQFEINANDVESDVLAFSKIIVDEKLPEREKDEKDEIAEIIAAMSNGMILWIDLHRSDLSSNKNKTALLQSVEETPMGLQSIYERNWQFIQNLKRRYRSRALSILRWVTFSARPLTVRELTEALLVLDTNEPENVDFDNAPRCIDADYIANEIYGLCGSLIEFRNTRSNPRLELLTLHLRHFSVRHFLLSKEILPELSDTTTNSFRDCRVCNNSLSISCIRYLQNLDVQKELASNSAHLFADYAVRYWHIHSCTSGTRFQEFNRIAHRFFRLGNPAFVFWRKEFEKTEMGGSFQELDDVAEAQSRLYFAARLGLEEIVVSLHRQDPRVLNAIGGHWGTPLMAACIVGSLSLIKRMRILGADLQAQGGRFGSALATAAWRGNVQICRYLLANGTDVDVADESCVTPLLIACAEGHLNIVSLFLEYDANIYATDIDERSPLGMACYHGNVEVVELLLEHNVPPSIVFKDGRTPLGLACVSGQIGVVEFLLAHSADITTTDSAGAIALHIACGSGPREAVEVLLKQHKDLSIDATTFLDNDGWTALHYASLRGNPEIAKMLLEHGFDHSATNKDDLAPLQIAVREGQLATVQLLLESGADGAVQTKEKLTLLQLAAIRGHLEIVKFLLSHDGGGGGGGGGNCLATDKYGETALHKAARRGKVDVVQALLDAGADYSIKAEDDKWTALHYAANSGHTDIVKLLLDRGADHSPGDIDGETPLYRAALDGHSEVVQMLINAGAECCVKAPSDDWTPLHHAANWGHLDTVKILLDNGAECMAIDVDGQTALHRAAYKGHVAIMTVLLDRGADVHCMTASSQTPLHYACRRSGSPEAVRLLIDHGGNLHIHDDYGQTCLDWMVNSPELAGNSSSNTWLAGYTPTSNNTRQEIASKSVNKHISRILTKKTDLTMYSLTDFLKVLGDVENVYRACEYSMTQNDENFKHYAGCDACPNMATIKGRRYICLSCLDIDFCESCHDSLVKEDERYWACRDHEFLAVPRKGVELEEKRYVDHKDGLDDWLRELQKKYTDEPMSMSESSEKFRKRTLMMHE